jgi:hypothetical protein
MPDDLGETVKIRIDINLKRVAPEKIQTNTLDTGSKI